MIAKNTSNIFTPLDVLPRDFKHFINMQKEADNAATKKNKRLGTTGKDPQRKRTSSNKNEGVEIKRKDLLKEADNAATKNKRLGDPQRKRTSSNKNEGVEIKRKDLLKEADNAATKKK